MTRCNATAELVDANMRIIPGITLVCELEAGHNERQLVELGEHIPGGYRPPEDEWVGTARYYPATEHAHTLRWPDPTAAELAEVLDPDESFDLEVDIAPEAVLEQQQNAGIANGTVGPGQERDYPRGPEL